MRIGKLKRGTHRGKLSSLSNNPKSIQVIKIVMYTNRSRRQWVDMGAVQEVVVYSNTGDYNMKGHFASYDATQPHWKYFWLD